MKKLLIAILLISGALCADEAWKPLPTKPVKPPQKHADGTKAKHCTKKNKTSKSDKKKAKQLKKFQKMRKEHFKRIHKEKIRQAKKKLKDKN